MSISKMIRSTEQMMTSRICLWYFVFLSAIDFLIIFPLPQFFTQVSYISLSNELEIVRVLKMDKMVINEKRGVPTMIYCLFVLCGDFCSSIFNSFLISWHQYGTVYYNIYGTDSVLIIPQPNKLIILPDIACWKCLLWWRFYFAPTFLQHPIHPLLLQTLHVSRFTSGWWYGI